MSGVGGMVFGAALMCLIAPREFLLGPIGEKWMGFIGVRTAAGARFVSVLVLAAILTIANFPLIATVLQAHGILPPKRF